MHTFTLYTIASQLVSIQALSARSKGYLEIIKINTLDVIRDRNRTIHVFFVKDSQREYPLEQAMYLHD